MLRYTLLHPQILHTLGTAGHGSQILIADSNYPFSTGANRDAERVYLNLAPGLVGVLDVLRVLTNAIPIEAAQAITPDNGLEPAIFADYRQLLPALELQPLGRRSFYESARSADTALVIATGEQRTWACILLTIGVVQPD
ncbi:MAG: RbsD/FucU family protein [Anaerolineae bacterium]|nr:RbsD/FucU family protein [Anaerolineae bacterium]